MDDTCIDAVLLARIAQRDAQALDALYTRYARAVFSLGLAMLEDQARAADLTQEVFLLVWRHAGTYQPIGSAQGWLLRLARNRAIDELRHDRRRPHHRVAPAEQTRRALVAPPAWADAAERQAIRDAMAALPAEQREALRLAFFQDLTHQEIAEQLRIPLGTIKARIRRALQALRQWFAEDEG